MFYEKKIRYLEYWKNGEKIRSVGFVRIELLGEFCNVQAQVAGIPSLGNLSRELKVRGQWGEGVLGRMEFHGGRGYLNLRQQNVAALGEGGIPYEKLEEMYIQLSAGQELLCKWKEPADRVPVRKIRGNVPGAEAYSAQKTVGNVQDVVNPGFETAGIVPKRANPGHKTASIVPERANPGPDTVKAMPELVNPGLETAKAMPELVNPELETANAMPKLVNPELETASIMPEEANLGLEMSKAMPGAASHRIGKTSCVPERVDPGHETAGIAPEKVSPGPDTVNAMPEVVTPGLETANAMREAASHGHGKASCVSETVSFDPGLFSSAQRMGSGMDSRARKVVDSGQGVGSCDRSGKLEKEWLTEKEERQRTEGRQEKDELGWKSSRRLRLFEDKWRQLSSIYPHVAPFQDERDYLSITPADFVVLQKQYHKLVSNSFLLHGYYNYEHLILTRVERTGAVRYYVGVPGNFYEKERQVALMFGFETFECKREPVEEGDFGYYCIRVDL